MNMRYSSTKIITMTTALCFIMILLSASLLADPYPAGLFNHPFNGSSKPVTKNGITTFKILDRQCSNVDYGDGRGENDCKNGAVRSVLVRSAQARLGSKAQYSFDIWINPGFSYPGFNNPMSTGFLPDSWDSRLRIASWEGPFIHNFLYMLKADARHGVSFLGNECQPSSKFGTWVSFSMNVFWTNGNDGWIDVKCDGRSIYKAEKISTNQNPHCYVTNQCESDVPKNPKKVLFILGPVMAGFGHEWNKFGLSSPFTDIQKDGIEVRVRNVTISG